MRRSITSSDIPESVPDFNHYCGELCFSFEKKIFYYQKKLGSGGFGTVFLFESKHPPMQVAIKEDHKHNGYFCNGNSFELEAQWYKKIYGLGELSGNPKNKFEPHYILMPYFPGETLYKIHYPSLHNLLSYWMKTAHAVWGFYEKTQAVHCDIKADNVIINTDTNTAAIIDFGLMCTENETRHYQFYENQDDPSAFWQHAPEVFANSSKKITASHTQDIYSLGMILISAFKSFMMNTFVDISSSDASLTIRLVHSKLTHQNPLNRWSIAKAIYMLATTFFSKIPRLFWLTHNDDKTQIQLSHDDMMTTVWKTTSILALQYCVKKLEDEQKTLSFLRKKFSKKPEKMLGIKKLQSDIVVSDPALFSEKVSIAKKEFPNLTAGIFLNRTETLLQEIAQTAQFLH